MNIISKTNNINEINKNLKELINSDWKSEELSPNKIQKFMNENLKIIANQKDLTLHSLLMQLSNRINNEWNNSEAHNLSFEIMGIAKGVLVFHGELPAGIWHTGVWRNILSFIPPSGDEVRLKKGGIPSGLETFYPSRVAKELARKVEQTWVGEELVSLKKYGCKTAKEAIEYAIKNNLEGANLSEFPDLDENDLNGLFENCKSLNQLFIRSRKILNLPAAASRLKTLYCSGCINLQSLPELPQVQWLNCSGCKKLQSLPELPQVQWLNCSECKKLQSLPELPQVQELNCSDCEKLQSLPELPQVQELNCSDCKKLQSLPEMPQVLKLYCSWCKNLQSLPELPQVLTLHCGGCEKLQSLPKMPLGATVLR